MSTRQVSEQHKCCSFFEHTVYLKKLKEQLENHENLLNDEKS